MARVMDGPRPRGNRELKELRDREFKDLVQQQCPSGDIENLDDDLFREFVDREARGRMGTHYAALLRRPEVVNRWYFALVLMKKSVESQLGAKRADVDLMKQYSTYDDTEYQKALADYKQWRAGALRFKSGVEERMVQARQIRTRLGLINDEVVAERNRLSDQQRMIVEAIQRHRKTVNAEYDPTQADLELWGVLETVAN